MDSDEAEFRRLILRRTDLIDSLMSVCDSASGFAIELETFAHQTPRNRAAVARILGEVVAMREACQRILEQLQRQPPTPPREPPAAAEDKARPTERKRPDHLRVVKEDDVGSR